MQVYINDRKLFVGLVGDIPVPAADYVAVEMSDDDRASAALGPMWFTDDAWQAYRPLGQYQEESRKRQINVAAALRIADSVGGNPAKVLITELNMIMEALVLLEAVTDTSGLDPVEQEHIQSLVDTATSIHNIRQQAKLLKDGKGTYKDFT